VTLREMNTENQERSRSVAFVALLIEDIIAARQRLIAAPTQTARRDVVRTSLAAIEGMTWVAREHVRTALASVEHLSPIADLALREQAYTVSDNGQVAIRSQGLPLLTTIRLVVSQASILSPELAVEFATSGWADLRQSVNIRNRITHPKPGQEFTVSDEDLVAVASAVSWLVATLDYVMTSTNLALTRYNDSMRDTVQRLAAGDPAALEEYHAALQEAEGED